MLTNPLGLMVALGVWTVGLFAVAIVRANRERDDDEGLTLRVVPGPAPDDESPGPCRCGRECCEGDRIFRRG